MKLWLKEKLFQPHETTLAWDTVNWGGSRNYHMHFFIVITPQEILPLLSSPLLSFYRGKAVPWKALNRLLPWHPVFHNVMHFNLLMLALVNTLFIQASQLGADSSWFQQIEALLWDQDCILYSPVTCSAPSMVTHIYLLWRFHAGLCVCVQGGKPYFFRIGSNMKPYST